jgi:monoamine oxidase
MTPDYDVLVLGAGAAGLAAADQLAAAGRRVALIEGRNRVGGRIFTEYATLADGASLPVELGAEFIHGLPPESWRLIREADLDTYELDGAMLSFAQEQLQSQPPRSGSREVLEELTHWLKHQPPGTDQTFEQYLQHSALAGADAGCRDEAIRYVEGFNAADHRVIGVAALVRQQEAEDRVAAERLFHIRGGYAQLPRFLSNRLQGAGGALFLDRPVSRIAWRAGEVVMSGVDSRGGPFEFRAAQAVITLPVGVLQAEQALFDPPPTAALEAVRRMAMGSVVRVPLVFRSRFWRDAVAARTFPELVGELEEFSFLFADQGAPPTWWTSHPEPAPTLVAWVAGPGTAALDRTALADACLRMLGKMFQRSPTELAGELLSWHFHDWDADPFSRGAYSYMPAGALHASAEMALPVQATLYFAGEHTTNSGHWGTVHGALQSGAAAASAILRTTLPLPTVKE